MVFLIDSGAPGTVGSNENLIDNWCFVDPVNQRGATSYYGSEAYTIDRWKATNINTTVSLDGSGVKVAGDAEKAPYIRQLLNNRARLLGRDVTLTVLMADGTLYTKSDTLPAAYPSTNTFKCVVANVCQVMLTTSTVSVRLLAAAGQSNTFVAVKLEFGTTQTLAVKGDDGKWVLNDPIPNKGLETVKCRTSTADSADAFANGSVPGMVQTGSYVGTGTYGSENPNVITFDFVPVAFAVVQKKGPLDNPYYGAFYYETYGNRWQIAGNYTTEYQKGLGLGTNVYGKCSADRKTYSWYTDTEYSKDAEFQCNSSDYTYYWIAIG